ncbi:hypothetical protein [Falsiroseomonas sp. HW251]|uniref:hypothetical protein n=1 Tax=Falsiroseomonas sp. HW251 TaxID=3390998 RepID=UPI003D3161A6
MPTVLPAPVDVGLAEYVPSRSGQGSWGPSRLVTRTSVLPEVGEFILVGEQNYRVCSIRIDLTGEQRVVLFGLKVNQPSLPS